MLRHAIALCLIATDALTGGRTAAADPDAVYLTWQRDPTTTMTVQWLSKTDQTDSRVRYAPDDGGPVDRARWTLIPGRHHPMPHYPRLIHQAELTGLAPDTMYLFRVGESQQVYRFRTMPATMSRPVRFAVASDMFKRDEDLAYMHGLVAAREPDFLIMAGDIAGDNGNPDFADRWVRFLGIGTEHLVGAGGRLIPCVPVIGNHETPNGGFNQTPDDPPFFFDLFAYPASRATTCWTSATTFRSSRWIPSTPTPSTARSATGWSRPWRRGGADRTSSASTTCRPTPRRATR